MLEGNIVISSMLLLMQEQKQGKQGSHAGRHLDTAAGSINHSPSPPSTLILAHTEDIKQLVCLLSYFMYRPLFLSKEVTTALNQVMHSLQLKVTAAAVVSACQSTLSTRQCSPGRRLEYNWQQPKHNKGYLALSFCVQVKTLYQANLTLFQFRSRPS